MARRRRPGSDRLGAMEAPGERKKPPGCTLGCYTGHDDDGGLPRPFVRLIRMPRSPHPRRQPPLKPPLRGRLPLSQKATTCRFASHRIYARHVRLKKGKKKRNLRGGTLIRLTCRRLACSGARVRDPARTMSGVPRLEGPHVRTGVWFANGLWGRRASCPCATVAEGEEWWWGAWW